MVVYLRTIAEPIRTAAGFSPNSLFPLSSAKALGPFLLLAKIELAREAATLVMMAAIAWATARNFYSWLAAFSLVFGVWDLTFYFWLKVMIDWPQSLGTWDLLFLLPVPWVGPVVAPSMVAVSLIAGGVLGLIHDPRRVSARSWVLLITGAALIYISFVWDWRYIVAGGFPRQFPWAIFSAGELAGVVGLAMAWRGEKEIRQKPEVRIGVGES